MPTQTVTLLNQANRSGILASPAVDWPANVTEVSLRITGTHTDPAETVQIIVEESTDGGTTWVYVGGGAALPGGLFDKQGNPALPRTTISRDFPFVPRRIRAQIVIVGTVRIGAVADVTTE